MNAIAKQAYDHATRIKWEPGIAFEYCIALLTECNCHTEARALEQAIAAKAEEDAKVYAALAAPEPDDTPDDMMQTYQNVKEQHRIFIERNQAPQD